MKQTKNEAVAPGRGADEHALKETEGEREREMVSKKDY